MVAAKTLRDGNCLKCGCPLLNKYYASGCCSVYCYDRHRYALTRAKVFRPMPCINCGTAFTPDRSTARFCSLSCKHNHHGKKKSFDNTCGFCRRPFKGNSKTTKYCSVSCGLSGSTSSIVKSLNCTDCGLSFTFCGRTSAKRCAECHRKARKQTVLRYNTKMGEAQARVYTGCALQYYQEECVVCGVKEPVQIHHINGKRSDNRLCNLVPLCANHHYIVHRKSKNYSSLSESLFAVWPLGRTKIAELSGDLLVTGQSEPKASDG